MMYENSGHARGAAFRLRRASPPSLTGVCNNRYANPSLMLGLSNCRKCRARNRAPSVSEGSDSDFSHSYQGAAPRVFAKRELQ
jgi:hypothetical protein